MEKKRPFLVEALAQVFIGPRGLLKMGQIWLPLSLILVAGTRQGPGARFTSSLYLLCAVFCKGLSTILINDLTDVEIDRRAGKERWIASVPAPAGNIITVLLMASGFLALVKAGGGTPVLVSFTATMIVGVLYSLKPIRLKERGGWGVLAYGLSAAILHAIVPWTLFRPPLLLLPVLFSVMIGEKLVQILFHQIVDIDSDCEDKVRTFAVTVGRDKADRTLRRILHNVVVLDAALLIYIFRELADNPRFLWLVGLACLLGIAGSGFYARIISIKLRTSTELTVVLPWTYLGLSYLLFYMLPSLFFLSLVRREPEMWIMVTLSTLSLLGMSVNFFFYHHKR